MNLFRRAFTGAAVPYFLLFLAIVVYFVLELVKLILGDAFSLVLTVLGRCCCRTPIAAKEGNYTKNAEAMTSWVVAQEDWRATKQIAT